MATSRTLNFLIKGINNSEMNKRIKLLAVTAVMGLSAVAQTWVWYPGDFEIWLGNRMNNNRTERGAFFPPFWKTDSHFVTVEFGKDIDIPEDEVITIKAEGKYNVKLDGKLQFGEPSELRFLPAGTNLISRYGTSRLLRLSM